MNGIFYLDYSNNLRVNFIITETGIQCSLFCESDNERLSETIVKNLKEISSIEYIASDDVYRYKINDNIFVDISRKSGEIKYKNMLTSFEIRMLAQGRNSIVPFTRSDEIIIPKTDLHTHFAGAINVNSLVDIGLKHNIKYPIKYLELMGINIDKYKNENDDYIYLSQLSDSDLDILKKHLKLPTITQETFNKMEETYVFRGPFTKNKSLFPDYLRCLAKDYQKMGIEYVELSFSAFMTDSDYMQMLEDNLPIIEKETGVKIRFLAGLWRHSDKEWNLDEVDRITTIAKSPYIVGCDFMGHETNSSLDFEQELRELARYAMINDPNFVIRVHAGENPMFKTNVYDALKIIYDEHSTLEKEKNQTFPMPQVRIGHGLYGLDITSDGKWNELEPNAVLKLAKEMGAIIEFNMSSNLALNNINSISEVPIKRYVDAGIKIVLGTDGHGLYSTSNRQESVLALAAGLTDDDLKMIIETEESVIQKAKERELSHPNIDDVLDLYHSIGYSTDDSKPRYTAEVAEKYRVKNEELSQYLEEQLNQVGAIVDEKQINEEISGKTPIMITGASKANWPYITPEDQYYIQLTMQVLANVLNPQTTFIITGGTNFGVEKMMHEAVNRRNKNSEEPIVLLGTLTMEAVRNGAVEIEPNTITHATILEIDGHKANSWMDLPDTQLKYVQEHNGQMIAIGGGSVVNDMIQRAHNLGVSMHLMDGPYGASTNKSKSMVGNNYSFKSIEELLERLYNQNPNYFVKDFSLNQIEEYISTAQKMIMMNDEIQNADEDNEILNKNIV